MGREGSRKRYRAESHKHTQNKFSVADALHSVKRRRLSGDLPEPGSPPSTSDDLINDRNDDDGWQTVSSKSSRRRHHKQRNLADRGSNYPSLTFYDKVTQPVRIDQLRDLALYVLADGLGPTWVAVKNKSEIKKVVAMTLPGFDETMLARAKELLKGVPTSNPTGTKQNGNSESLTIESKIGPGTQTVSDLLKEHAGLEDHLDWLLHDIIPVKAPGDSRYCKVHSPLQAMLMVPSADASDKSASGSNADKNFKFVQTPITYFVHTADELREAEYPIHPACFTSHADAALEHSRREGSGQSASAGWVDSNVKSSSPVAPSLSPDKDVDTISQGTTVYAIDCEMVLTSDEKSSLARVSVVAWPDGRVVLDKYVKPSLAITNYFTQFSGITPQILEHVTTKLSDIQQELSTLFDQSTILLGHSLESDLNALKLTHPFIIDTSIIFPHPRGLPLRSSLKFLANKYLKREIQTGGANGHDSVEDARAVLDLVKLKCEKGPRFGTTEAIGEPIFKRLSRATGRDKLLRTSAIVEYGSSPERGLGKDATYAIGCQDDDEIVAGMIRAIQGDPDGKEIPAGGVDFVWGRPRALEFARGWVTNSSVTATKDSNSASTKALEPIKHQVSDTATSASPAETETNGRDSSNGDNASIESSQIDLDRTLVQTLHRLAQICRSLPPTTLLTIYSGTSDVRPVLEYQAMQNQYRKEFKTKKWDELTVKWTDVEEQAMRKAAEVARRGWGYVGIV